MPAAERLEGRVVEPVLDWAAVENARLVNQARVALLTSGTAATIEMIAEATGKQLGAVRRWVARQRQAHRMVTVSHDGQLYVPTFQLTAAFDDVDADIAEIVRQLVGHGMDGWAVWDWFQVPNTWLGGDTPADRLSAGELDAVRRAVSGLLQE